jgi:hypothetical protein
MTTSVTLINNNLTFSGFDVQLQRCVANAESKKSKKVDRNGNKAEETNASVDGHSSSGYTSEEHNMYEENSGGTTSASKSTMSLNSNGKTRANRGSATDPQSLYARVIKVFFLASMSFITIPFFNLHCVVAIYVMFIVSF